MLSYEDIIRGLGESIIIHPLKTSNIHGASVSLTASNWAWSLKNGTEINAIKNEEKPEEPEKLIIEREDCVLIITHETVAIDYNLMGELYSKSDFIVKGLSPISGLVHPGYVGRLIFMYHNNSNMPRQIECRRDAIAQIAFNKLTTKTNQEYEGRRAFTTLLQDNGIQPPKKYREEVDSGIYTNFEGIKKIFLRSEDENAEVLEKMKEFKRQVKTEEENKPVNKVKQKLYKIGPFIILGIIAVGSAFLPIQEQARTFLGPLIAIIAMAIAILKDNTK
ncbi:MAG: hypothetical protein FWC71_06310 [Defluviitaleaceae bacterium]|nr:hypothetical protein [Defluviitaleaceae bacterium]